MSGYGNRGGGYGRGRSGDDYNNGGNNSLDVFVPAGDCGKIIGRGGSKIRDLQDQSRCRIKVSREDEGNGTRRVELCGSSDAIESAKALIAEILEGGDDRGGRQYGGQSYGGGGGGGSKEVIQVDSSFVGRIIGKGGSRVRELQEETGCRINVSRDGGRYGQTDVELQGSRSAIEDAKRAIDDLVNQA